MKLFAFTMLISALAMGVSAPARAQVQQAPAAAGAGGELRPSITSTATQAADYLPARGSNVPSPLASRTPADAFKPSSANTLNPVSTTGILSDSASGHKKHGIIRKVLEGAVTEPANAAVSFLFMGTDLPPDDATNPEWPFMNPHRKTLATVTWTDGSSAKMSRLPDGSYQILGSGKRFIMQAESEGSYALMGDYGSMATMTRRPGGGFVIIKADGHVEQVVPRQGGGYIIEDTNGVIATILPGADSAHVMRGGSTGSLF